MSESHTYQSKQDFKNPRITALREIARNPIQRAVGLSIARDGMAAAPFLREGSPAFHTLRESLLDLHSEVEGKYQIARDLCAEGNEDACEEEVELEGKLIGYLRIGNELTDGGVMEQSEKLASALAPKIVIHPYEDEYKI